ncbi:hypothetical protein DYB32_003387 [Aphanomyces invadans]|uniref:Reverse transcriptase domain-containing protein n=1 Tax=Aphanomyces invadans TaxID=157072 RepID=A0A418B0R1_9STRA|nr:hypothetical protein DYB32_003387 [Aphanomyces invadans]
MRCRELANAEIDASVAAIEDNSPTSRMFAAVKDVARRTSTKIRLKDDNNRTILNEKEALRHFQEQIFDNNRWTSPRTCKAKPLDTPITAYELTVAFKRLHGNRAHGPDGVPGELVNATANVYASPLADLINAGFAQGEPLDLGAGTLICLPKLNKPRGLCTSFGVLRDILEDDEVRLVAMFLSSTSLTLRLNGLTHEPFVTNTGTPQGDALSPALFTVYLVAALREVAAAVGPTFNLLGINIAYADDADFICPSQEVMTKITAKAVPRRKSLAKTAFSQKWKIWMRRELVSESNRARLYKVYVLPVLLYNCGTWALTPTQLDGLEAFHRRQLRLLLGIFYPHRILAARHRWRLFGHVLRAPQTPQHQTKTTLPVVLHRDLQCVGRSLLTTEDLDVIRTTAQDRGVWKCLTDKITTTSLDRRSPPTTADTDMNVDDAGHRDSKNPRRLWQVRIDALTEKFAAMRL